MQNATPRSRPEDKYFGRHGLKVKTLTVDATRTIASDWNVEVNESHLRRAVLELLGDYWRPQHADMVVAYAEAEKVGE